MDRDSREFEAWLGALKGQGLMGMPFDWRKQGTHNCCGPVGPVCALRKLKFKGHTTTTLVWTGSAL